MLSFLKLLQFSFLTRKHFIAGIFLVSLLGKPGTIIGTIDPFFWMLLYLAQQPGYAHCAMHTVQFIFFFLMLRPWFGAFWLKISSPQLHSWGILYSPCVIIISFFPFSNYFSFFQPLSSQIIISHIHISQFNLLSSSILYKCLRTAVM